MIGWAIETLVATSLLMLLVLALRGPVRKAFGPHLAYALWLLPVLRLVMPPLPGDWQLSRLIAPVVSSAETAPGVVVGVLNPATMPAEAVDTASLHTVGLGSNALDLALVPPTSVADGPNLLLLLGIFWAAGALAFLAWHLIAHSRYTARLLRRARIDRTVAQGRVHVIETDAAHGPLAFGVWRKYVAFPRDFAERYDEQERDLALAHELGHHARGDLIANWVALVVLALHWFNPLAWRAFRAFRADQEMACDALVLAGRAQALRHAYGRAIVKSAHGGAVSAACHLHTINDVKGRLRMLSKTHTSSPARIVTGLFGIGAVSLAALGLTASGTQAAEHIVSKVEAATGVSLHQDVPAQTARPEAPERPEAAERTEKRTYSMTTRSDGLDGKRIKKIVMVRADGTTTETEMPDIDKIMANVPEVTEAKCGTTGTSEATVIHRQDGKKQIMIICADRIEKLTNGARTMSYRFEHEGMTTALASLRLARRTIEADVNLSAGERAKAIAGIDQAVREVEANKSDKD